MDSTTPGQKCAICGITIPVERVWSNALFEEARCDPCMKLWGALPIETLRASVSVAGLDWDKISTSRRDELLELQVKKIRFEKEVEKEITYVRNSIIPIGREFRIAHIKEAAAEERKKILLEIKELIENIKSGLQKEG